MSKRKQEVVNSDIASKKSPATPLAIAGIGNPEITDETGVSRHTDLCRRKPDTHLMERPVEVKASSKRAQLNALSKFVNKAFTGWTIKTQS